MIYFDKENKRWTIDNMILLCRDIPSILINKGDDPIAITNNYLINLNDKWNAIKFCLKTIWSIIIK